MIEVKCERSTEKVILSLKSVRVKYCGLKVEPLRKMLRRDFLRGWRSLLSGAALRHDEYPAILAESDHLLEKTILSLMLQI
jgi:hypothetical protein